MFFCRLVVPRLFFALATLLSLCALQAASVAVGEQPVAAEYAASDEATHKATDRATVATAWFELQLTLVQETPGFSPPVAARSFAYTGLTLYEAVVPGLPEFRTLVGQLNGLSALPQPRAGEAYHWPAVANTALARMLEKLFSSASRKNLAAIARLEQEFTNDFTSAVDSETLERSFLHGVALADAIYAWSSTDGGHQSESMNFREHYLAPVGSGLWEPTPRAVGEPFPALQPYWGDNRPFVLASGADCAPPPPEYSEDRESTFYQQAVEVYQTVRHITPQQREIALYWSDDAGGTATPAGHWIAILTSIIRERDYSLAFAAEAYAKLGMATSDAFVSCWNTKYRYNLLRPITYIQRFIDAGWNQPMLTDPLMTPPFPEYTSGHSVQTAAAAHVLTQLLGEGFAFVDDTHAARGYAPRSFNSFLEAAEEAAMSRLYGGIHFRAAIEHGLAQGACVGQRVASLDFHRHETP